MCILGVLLRMHHQYPFILIDNRDEYLHRPTEPHISLNDQSGIICARDLVCGGTWCGCNAYDGTIAVLTNVYEPGVPVHKRSRGEIIDYLLSLQQTKEAQAQAQEQEQEQELQEEVNEVDDNEVQNKEKAVAEKSCDHSYRRHSDHLSHRRWLDEYNGFNVVVGNVFDICLTEDAPLYSMSNRKQVGDNGEPAPYGSDEGAEIESFTRGVFSVANSFMNDDSWAKVRYLRNEMDKTLQRLMVEEEQNGDDKSISVEKLRDELSNLLLARSLEEYPQLPDCVNRQVQRYANVMPDVQKRMDHDLRQHKVVTPQNMLSFAQENMNNIFVQYNFDGVLYKTRSQTVIIGENNGTVHYFYRTTDHLETVSPLHVPCQWDHITFSPPK